MIFPKLLIFHIFHEHLLPFYINGISSVNVRRHCQCHVKKSPLDPFSPSPGDE